ncbi:unnamed protein product, partial [Ilex paraguariensis]
VWRTFQNLHGKNFHPVQEELIFHQSNVAMFCLGTHQTSIIPGVLSSQAKILIDLVKDHIRGMSKLFNLQV